jgi:transglutaminase-like putative cysteine protease
MIPVEPTPDTVVVPVIAAWLAGLAGTEVAVRAGRVLAGLLPAVALYAGALYVVGPNAPGAGWTTVLFAGLAVVALAASARPDGDPALAGVPAKTRAAVRGRAVVGAAVGLAVVLGLVAAVGPWVGRRVAATPVDPRRYVQPPQVDSLDESPLNRISGWALTPKQRLLDVTTSGQVGKAKTVRLRLAVLPDYDGITWRVGATYRNAGRVLPEQPRLADADITTVREQIVIDGLTGRLLPVVPTPTRVDGARVAFDAATGTLIRPEQLTAGVRYTVTSEVQTPDTNLLPTADVPSGPAVARYLTVAADVPDEIQRLADQLQEGNGAAYDRASAIEDFLAEHYKQVADAPSGHAYPNLKFFLFGPRAQGGQRGTSEQFAASFALLARLVGLPSRVVVGFDAPAAGGTVTAGDAIAWPEVLFDGLGWVAFDPMPKDKNPRPVEEDFTPKPTRPPSPPSDPPAPSESAPASSGPAVLAAGAGGGPGAVVMAGGASGSALLVLVAAGLTVVAMRRALRRRRLTAGSPDERITGAWSEFTDALRLAGRPVPRHLHATEAAEHAARPEPPPRRLRPSRPVNQEGLPPLDDLVAGINTVGFAPGAADGDQAERAGRQAVAYATALRERRSWWRRLWWSVHPGPLRWRRPPPPRARPARVGPGAG